MLTLKHIGAAVIASAFVTAIAIDTADARRGGGGGSGARAGSIGGGGAMRAGSIRAGGAVRAGGGARLAHVSNPIARPGLGNRPGGPDFGRPGRPGIDVGRPGRPGWGNNWGGGWPGYGAGWGAAAAVGAGLAYAGSNYCDPYSGYCNSGSYAYGSYAPAYGATYGASDAVAECARRFRSYDPASQTYLSYSGQRVSCP